jgi:hypothetical protein
MLFEAQLFTQFPSPANPLALQENEFVFVFKYAIFTVNSAPSSSRSYVVDHWQKRQTGPPQIRVNSSAAGSEFDFKILFYWFIPPAMSVPIPKGFAF